MQWLLWVVLLVLMVVGYSRWRTWQVVRKMPPESYLRPHDPAWSEAGERWLNIPTGVNLRDIGGYPTTDGKRVRWKQVYRSGTLNELSPSDVEQLAKHNLRLICDLRSPDEVADSPDDAARFGAHYKHLPIQADRSAMRQLRAAFFQPERLTDIMRESYNTIILEDNAAFIGQILRDISDPANLPLLFHCTAGKDRTGVTAALLLAVLGVPDHIIAADYALSNRYYHRFRAQVAGVVKKVGWMGLSVDSIHPLLIADGDMMIEMLAALRARYGSIEAYLTERAGLTPQHLHNLRQNLLEDAA
jgi:protein-tyrosine phosphatase